MKLKLTAAALALSIALPAVAADLVTFNAGEAAVAADVNSNFTAVEAAAAAAQASADAATASAATNATAITANATAAATNATAITDNATTATTNALAITANAATAATAAVDNTTLITANTDALTAAKDALESSVGANSATVTANTAAIAANTAEIASVASMAAPTFVITDSTGAEFATVLAMHEDTVTIQLNDSGVVATVNLMSFLGQDSNYNAILGAKVTDIKSVSTFTMFEGADCDSSQTFTIAWKQGAYYPTPVWAEVGAGQVLGYDVIEGKAIIATSTTPNLVQDFASYKNNAGANCAAYDATDYEEISYNFAYDEDALFQYIAPDMNGGDEVALNTTTFPAPYSIVAK
ncbi:hypothetical protein RGQ13_08135 [Thalassotalea psychrophila]|uniref:Uncharacterized protein n=1 Tax=Thalassotalea psychrophila TaxID=3065647 RepID=A0ABY9TYR2_9GAMM|nr:hypothetical protein RGQ13_08135 [Colwelliaceae bacterium SQ149]